MIMSDGLGALRLGTPTNGGSLGAYRAAVDEAAARLDDHRLALWLGRSVADVLSRREVVDVLDGAPGGVDAVFGLIDAELRAFRPTGRSGPGAAPGLHRVHRRGAGQRRTSVRAAAGPDLGVAHR